MTINLGQVAGLFVGLTPPTNTTLIWYDVNPSIMLHKVYDENLAQWVSLDKNQISVITYSELQTQAAGSGFAVGEWFRITDVSNVLALAITQTKIQYTDMVGNILIDDLNNNIQYHVTSSNLLIDDVQGVFDTVTRKLVFQFNEVIPNISNQYVLGKGQIAGVWRLLKYRLSNFLSSFVGNSITWRSGFYFNFNDSFVSRRDVPGGFVSVETFSANNSTLNQSINNIANNYQNLQNALNNIIQIQFSATEIYSKRVPSVTTTSIPANIVANDTLQTIVNKVQSWINVFKYATGISIVNPFSVAPDSQAFSGVNSGDTVQVALAKLQHSVNKLRYANNIKVVNESGSFTPVADGIYRIIQDTDDVKSALEKLNPYLNRANNKTNGMLLSSNVGVVKHTDGYSVSTPIQKTFERLRYDINSCIQYDLVIDDNTKLKNMNSLINSSIHSILIKGSLTLDIGAADWQTVDLSNYSSRLNIDMAPNTYLYIYNSGSGGSQIFIKGYNDNRHRFNGNNGWIQIENTGGVDSITTYLNIFYHFDFISNVHIHTYNELRQCTARLNECRNVFNVYFSSWQGGSDRNFYNCGNVSKCRGSFYKCSILTDCSGDFIGCENLVNCNGNFNADTISLINPYHNKFLVNCVGDFYECWGIRMCNGTFHSNCKIKSDGSGNSLTSADLDKVEGAWNSGSVS